jgi:hypothetical protein
MANEKEKKQFELFVEMDETYVGGKPRKPNAILDKDGNVIARTKPKTKTKRGRGTKKLAVVGIKERSTTKVYVKFMEANGKGERLTGKQLLGVIKEACKNGTMVATDDFGGYNILDKKRQQKIYGHVTVCHSKASISKMVEYIPTGLKTFGVF